MSVFLFSLAGIPPLAGWYGKLTIFLALIEPGTLAGYILAVIVGLASVIALFYYARVAKVMFVDPAPDGDTTPIRVPMSLAAALTITVAVTLVVGVLPQVLARVTGAETFLSIGG
jgi:NADH-quinone oxidoreductase subunit N